jgi:hypothetical protein
LKRTALLRIRQEGIQRFLPLTKGPGRDYRIEASSLRHGWAVPLPRDRNVELTAPVTWEMVNRRRADFETLVREMLERLMPANMECVISHPAGGGNTTVLKLLVYTVSHLSQHMGQAIVTRRPLDGEQ